jgi:Ca2+-binding RTX toxin-like protein
MTTDSLTLATQAGAHATLSPAVLHLFGQVKPAAEAVATAAVTARAYHYGPETASLFEAVSEVVYPSDGGTALKPQIREGWRTYNFEVEDLHTYIAGGLRVHNTSVLDILPQGASNIHVEDRDRDGKYDFATYDLPNGVKGTTEGRQNGDGTTLEVARTTEVQRDNLLGPRDIVRWQERYEGGKLVKSEAVRIDYAQGSIQGEEIGRTLGSVLGNAIGTKSVFARVGTATIAATLLQNVGEFLHKNVDFSLLASLGNNANPLDNAIKDTFNDFGLDLKGNAGVQIINALSGVLVGEIADALDLQGFERGVFSTVGNTVTNQVLGNIANMLQSDVPATVIDASTNLLKGFDFGNMAGNIANGLGGYFGSQLGNLAVKPKSPQSALFGSAAAAVSTYVASTAAAAAAIPLLGIPVIGPLVAAFAAQALGNLLGNAFWDDDRVAHYTLFTDGNGTVQYGYPHTQDGASLVFSDYLAKTTRDSINSIYGNASASIDPNRAFNPFQIGWYVNSQNQKIMFTRSTAVQAPFDVKEAQGLIAASVDYAVANSELAGGDLFIRRAYTASHKSGLAQLSFDLQVAKDFRKYVENTNTINSVIADSPTSDFSAGWIATLQRAKELGLNRLVDFNAMEYLASHGDLQQAFGRDKAAAERHMIESGIPEGRQVSFDALQYLAANGDLAQAYGTDRDRAAAHYMDYGRNEGRPTQFDAYQYMAANGDVARYFGVNNPDGAVGHYIWAGRSENRATTFDYKQYLAANPGLKEELGGVDATNAARHYVETGMREGLPTQFNNYSYLASYPDLWNAFGRNFGALHQHVLDYGLRPTTFDADAYLNAHPDLQAAFGTNVEAAAEHFNVHGRHEAWRSATWIGGPDERHIMGGAGRDTVSYAYASAGMIVDLNAQRTWNGHVGDHLSSVENAIGSRFDDTFIAGAGTTALDGRDGNDILHIVHSNQASIRGGNGVDTISYEYAQYGYTVDLNARITNRTGIGGGEFLDSIESAIGSRFNDALIGSNGDNGLHGGAGNDTLYGLAGNDWLDGGDFEDTLFGGDGNDVLIGNNGFDVLQGEGGNDTFYGGNEDDILDGGSGSNRIDGGSGTDTVSFGSAATGYVIDLNAQTTWNGQVGDSLVSIENAIGSRFNDNIYGNDADNVFEGNGGLDTIHGGGGSDTISLAHADQGIVIGIDNQVTWDGRHLVRLTSIENGIGSRFNDLIVGNDENNILEGNGGDDTIHGGGGSDTISLAHADQGIVIGIDFQVTWDGHHLVKLTSIENGIGSRFNDLIVGNDEDNVLTGGAGADIFRTGRGRDTITDFNVWEGDRFDLQGQSYWTNTSQNRFALLMLSNGGVVELRGINPGAVNSGWFG